MILNAIRGLTLLSLAAVLSNTAATVALPKSDIGSKKILVLLPLATPSHHNVFSALTDELLDRGHFLTIVSSRMQKRKHTRLTEVLINDPLEVFLQNMTQNFFKKDWNLIRDVSKISIAGSLITGAILENPKVLALRDEKFDLVITEAWFFQEALLGFAHHYGCPSMAVNPFGYTHHLNYYTGGSANFAYVPNIFADAVMPDTFWERTKTTLVTTIWMLYYHFVYYPKVEAQLHKAFPNAPPLRELVNNMTLTLINNNNALMTAVPLAPSVIEVGGLHIKPGKPLPADLKSWIEESKDGIVYFSMGSNLRADSLPEEKLKAIFESFAKLKQRVLVKWNSETPLNAPVNCRFEKWIPQQEVLAHPNLRVFATHGGLLSTQEAVYYGAAIIGMPVFGDQFSNTNLAEALGFGIRVSIFDLTTDKLDAALHEVINNPKYREKSKELSARFRLDPVPPLQKAVYYTEQLIKLGTFKHLQPSSINLHWYQYLLLDVLGAVAVAFYLFYRVIRCICSTCLRFCSKNSKAKKD